MNLTIRETTEVDRKVIYDVEAQAFGYDKEAQLVESLLDDPTAKPSVSLLAFEKDQAIGHILFTAATIDDSPLKASILAPLAVVPNAQGKGIGGKLIEAGLNLLSQRGVDLVFVLGHPTYYPRSGFVPAHTYALKAPYPIPEEHADAWMVQALNGTALENASGNVSCADMLHKPEHWRE